MWKNGSCKKKLIILEEETEPQIPIYEAWIFFVLILLSCLVFWAISKDSVCV